MFPRCDRSVTNPPITVFGLGTPRCHRGVPTAWAGGASHRDTEGPFVVFQVINRVGVPRR
jgi:hypothetical protein